MYQLESALVGVLTLAALFLRLLRLDFQPLWWDEGYSVWFATHPLAEMVALTAQDIHPPLYYALLHGWIGLLGAGPISLRLLSALFGVVAIPAIYWTGRRLLGPRVGLLAAALLAINPLHIYYSQEVRMYGLVALLSIGVVAAGWGLMERIGESANRQIGKSANQQISKSANQQITPFLIAYILLSTAALYTQYYAVFLPIGLTIYAFWRWLRPIAHGEHDTVMRDTASTSRGLRSAASTSQGLWSAELVQQGLARVESHLDPAEKQQRDGLALRRWLLAQAAIALLYLPWALYAAPKLTLYVSQKIVADADRPLGLVEYGARHLAAFLIGHLPGPLAPYWPLALLLLLPLGLGWGMLLRSRQTTLSPRRPVTLSPCHLVFVVALTALALGWLISLRFPFFPEHGERLLLLALPPFILLLAGGLDALWAWGESQVGHGQRPAQAITPQVGHGRRPAQAITPQAGHGRRPAQAITPQAGHGRRPAQAAIPNARFGASLWPVSDRASVSARPSRVGRRTAFATLALLVATSAASLAAFYTVPRYPGDDYRPLIARTVEQGLPEDTIFAVYPWQVGYWRSYGSASGPTARLTPDADWTPAVAAALDDALARGKVWFPAHLALGAILETQVEAHLAGRAVPFINEWYGPGTRLSGWAVTAAPQPVSAPRVRFPLRGADGAAELIGVDASPGPIPAANAVTPITLRWDMPTGAPVLAVSVRLVDSIGRIWAQYDYEQISKSQIANPVEDHLGLLIPAGTPPGQYFVDVALRPKGDDRPLDVLAEDGRSLGAAARLFELTVAPAGRDLGTARLPIGTRQAQDFADGLRLLGHTLAARPVAPGEARPVNLFWQATGQPQADYVTFVQLLDEAGQVAAGWEAPPGGAHPTSAWPVGTLIRTQAAFRPRADLPDGRYRLIAGLFRAGDKGRLRTTGGADHILLGEVTVRGRPHDRTPPQPQYPTDVAFGQAGRLIGYNLAAPPNGFQPGSAIPLTLYWQAAAATDRPYTVFVHLVDETGAIHGYGDGEPGGGGLPTTSWLAGEYLADGHQVNVSSAAPPGAYRLRIGLYDPTTGQRLLTSEGRDHVEVGPVMMLGK